MTRTRGLVLLLIIIAVLMWPVSQMPMAELRKCDQLSTSTLIAASAGMPPKKSNCAAARYLESLSLRIMDLLLFALLFILLGLLFSMLDQKYVRAKRKQPNPKILGHGSPRQRVD
jgi:hypothetical protein